jgi:thymidine kinase
MRRGRIEVVCGCMFAGKTAYLIGRLRAGRDRGLRVGAFRHASDSRYHADHLATHDGLCFEAAFIASPDGLLTAACGLDLVGVDEAQFFGAALAGVCLRLARRGADVIAVGIDYDVRGRSFPPLPRLKRVADEVRVMTAPCVGCGQAARFSQRTSPLRGRDWVGGPGDYEPRCGDCFRPWSGSPGR